MGYALFTARKLMLQDRLNRMNYQMLTLQQQRNEMVDRESDLQIMQSFRSTAKNLELANEQNSRYQDILKNGGDTDSATTALQYEIEKKQAANQLQNAIDSQQLKNIQMVENQLDLQIQKLETQTQEASKELEKVEEAEKQGIEKSVPQYAGG